MIIQAYIDRAKQLRKELRKVEANMERAQESLQTLSNQLPECSTPRDAADYKRQIYHLEQYIQQCYDYSVTEIEKLRKLIQERHPHLDHETIVKELQKHLQSEA